MTKFADREFTVDDLTKAYLHTPGSLHTSKKAARQFVYRTMQRLLKSGDLQRVVADHRWPHYSLGKSPDSSQTRPTAPLNLPPVEREIVKDDSRRNLQDRLSRHKLEMLTAMGEAEEYEAICEEIPELQDQVQELYNRSRDACSKLLGRVKALESLLAREAVR